MERQSPDSYLSVARLSELDARGRLVVRMDGRRVANLRVAGELYAVDDTCPHRQGLLSEGDLCGFVLHCPLHAWPFDVRSGACIYDPSVRIRTWAVRVVGEEIQLKASGSASPP